MTPCPTPADRGLLFRGLFVAVCQCCQRVAVYRECDRRVLCVLSAVDDARVADGFKILCHPSLTLAPTEDERSALREFARMFREWAKGYRQGEAMTAAAKHALAMQAFQTGDDLAA